MSLNQNITAHETETNYKVIMLNANPHSTHTIKGL